MKMKTTYQNIWDTMKVVLTRKFTVINRYIKQKQIYKQLMCRIQGTREKIAKS